MSLMRSALNQRLYTNHLLYYFFSLFFELILPVAAVDNEDEILYQARATGSSMKPKATAIVVNYNSLGKWDIIESCLKRIFSLNYRPLEIIVVDNGSDDGSFELIKQLIEEIRQDEGFKIRIIRLSKNYGFAAANIIAYRLRDPESKYIALINNDLSPEPDSLERLIEILEANCMLAGVQGVILTWDGRYIDTYGVFMTDHGLTYPISSIESSCLQKLRPVIPTYIDGAFSMYRVEALERSGGLFMPYFFMWGDDYELGIRLWRSGYVLAAVPVVVGRHYRGASVQLWEKTASQLSYLKYWSWVSNIAVTVIYGHIFQLLRRMPTAFASIVLLKRSKPILMGFLDGIKLGFKLRKLLRQDWLRSAKEPRLRSNLLWELALLARFYLRYGAKGSKIRSILIGRSLSRRFALKSEKVDFKLNIFT
ncbi:MAG: hypothetical protein DSO07_04380 [Thermoproteota archaeon]|nr:MAG: hypothetical protein DSO07_04380 [Candidatus Korarchaeota archaeon]